MDKDQVSLTPLFRQRATPIAAGGLTLSQCTEDIEFETLLEELAEVIEQEGGVLIP